MTERKVVLTDPRKHDYFMTKQARRSAQIFVSPG